MPKETKTRGKGKATKADSGKKKKGTLGETDSKPIC